MRFYSLKVLRCLTRSWRNIWCCITAKGLTRARTNDIRGIYFKLQYATAPYKIFTLLSYYVKPVFLFIFPKIISHLLTGGFI